MCDAAEIYECPNCGAELADEELEHCPSCLCAYHDTDDCGGTMEPVSVWVKPDGKWELILRCRLCGGMELSPLHKDDDPVKVMSIVSKPLAMPPFPIEKLDALTRMMGGGGSRKGDEQ